MRRSWPSRLTTLLLITGILAGGSGAPVVDAIVYHTHPSRSSQSTTHFEAQGLRHAHGDACTLGWLLRVQPPGPTALPQLVVATALHAAPSPPPAVAVRSADLSAFPQSRAPPARSA